MLKVNLSILQRLGQSLLLPIAVMPVAGLLLRLGSSDMLDIPIIEKAGDAVFANLALLFAIGVAVGFARDNHGVAALAGGMGHVIMLAVVQAMNPKINMGVLSGILMGVTAGILYNALKDTKLPSYLAFFGGKRFVPIVTALLAVVFGIVAGYIWPPIQGAIDVFGQWLTHAGAAGLFLYGIINRLLLVTGLHHVLNSYIWFIYGNFTDETGRQVTGDIYRYFAGDKTAGAFSAGFYPVMMFGLPAACLAMYRHAKPQNRKAVAGIFTSMAVTSFLTGVTEPVEFSFLFLAPLLYGIHCVLTGLSLVIMDVLDVKIGFTFSAGFFDLILAYGKSTHGWLLFPVGVSYFLIYYGLFSLAINRFNLMTLGREPHFISDNPVVEILKQLPDPPKVKTSFESLSKNIDINVAGDFVAALGGAANIKDLDACATRLRLIIVKNDQVDDHALKQLGAVGLIRPTASTLQVIIGPEADNLMENMREYMRVNKDANHS